MKKISADADTDPYVTKNIIADQALDRLYELCSDSSTRPIFPQCAALYIFLRRSFPVGRPFQTSFRHIYSRTGVSPINLARAAQILQKYGLILFKRGAPGHPNVFTVLETPAPLFSNVAFNG